MQVVMRVLHQQLQAVCRMRGVRWLARTQADSKSLEERMSAARERGTRVCEWVCETETCAKRQEKPCQCMPLAWLQRPLRETRFDTSICFGKTRVRAAVEETLWSCRQGLRMNFREVAFQSLRMKFKCCMPKR